MIPERFARARKKITEKNSQFEVLQQGTGLWKLTSYGKPR